LEQGKVFFSIGRRKAAGAVWMGSMMQSLAKNLEQFNL
jgi:hypothetical protein